jgi:hypothetical protein
MILWLRGVFPIIVRSLDVRIRNKRLTAENAENAEKIQNLYQFNVLKKCRQGLCWGPGGRPERAGSIGWVSPCLRG